MIKWKSVDKPFYNKDFGKAVAGQPSPVPEPTTILLFGLGLLGLSGISRRRNQ